MAGTVPTAGITLTDDKNVQTKLPMDMIAMNTPSKVLAL
ncbi:hypothetical protein AB0X92_00045 [Bacteroides hominis]|nr:hypothetical protein [Bacteroides fragilis]